MVKWARIFEDRFYAHRLGVTRSSTLRGQMPGSLGGSPSYGNWCSGLIHVTAYDISEAVEEIAETKYFSGVIERAIMIQQK
jgi:hypothetical protein